MEYNLAQSKNFIDLIIQFYCGISGKKDIQTLSSEISEFVCQHEQIQNKQIMGKQILQYFLKLYSKYTIKTEDQWDNAFELSTARDRALIYLENFPLRRIYRFAFDKIKNKHYVSELYSQTIQTQISGNQLTIFDEIQVEEDIKLKTQYFFKWCQYLKHAKNFKSTKLKSVQNLKMSQCFNTYGMRFNYFTAWKRYTKKRINQKQKCSIIQSKSKHNKIKKCLSTLKQTGEILVIQEQLVNIVKSKLLFVGKTNVFKFLQKNKVIIKGHAQAKNLKQNIYAYRFFTDLTQGIAKTSNKSYTEQRKKLNLAFNKVISKKIFIFFKNRIQAKHNKSETIVKNILKAKFKHFLRQTSNNICFLTKQVKLKGFLSNKKMKIVMTILHFNLMAHEMQREKIQSIIQSGKMTLTDRNLLYVSRKKELKGQVSNYKSIVAGNQKKLFFCIYKQKKQENSRQEDNQEEILKLIKFRLFVNVKNNKKLLQQKYQYYASLQVKTNQILRKKMFKRWSKIFQYNQKESKALQSVSSLKNKILKIDFMNKLSIQATQQQRFNELTYAINLFILRIGFCKISGRTFSINRRIQNFNHIYKNRIKAQLFDLLLANKQFSEQKINEIKECQNDARKKNFMKKIMNFHEIKRKFKILSEQLKKTTKKKIIKSFFKQIKDSQDISIRKYYIAKMNFICNFKKSVRKQYQIFQSIQKGMSNCLKLLLQLQKSKFLLKLRTNRQEKQQYYKKCYEIVYKIAQKNTKCIKNNIAFIKNNQKIEQKVAKIKKNIILSGSYKILTMNHYRLKLAKNLKTKNMQHFIIALRNNNKRSQQINQKSKITQNFIFQSQVQLFFKNIVSEISEVQQKYMKIQANQRSRNKLHKKQFILMMSQNKENIDSMNQLVRTKTHKHLSELLTTFYSRKYGKIKFNCSLKIYATNLLKKSLKGLKKSYDKIKFKQNIMKLDKTSSMMAEKSIQKLFKSNTLSEQIQKLNLRKIKNNIR